MLQDKVLNIDKNKSVTSYDIVDQLKRLAETRKVGHAGSLDPFATGILLVCTRKATKITRFLMELEKEYVGTVRFGSETETDDSTGRVTFSKSDFSISRQDVEREASAFVGRIFQHPPRVSALKQSGVRLYELTRRGESFETEAREVTIHDFRILDFRFPDADFLVRCSKGTYVRALARDIGRKLGPGAHLVALRRVKIGHFAIEDAISVEALKEMLEGGRIPSGRHCVCSMEEALSFMPACFLKKGIEHKVIHGRGPSLSEVEELDTPLPAGECVRIHSSDGKFLAIGRTSSSLDDTVIRLEKVVVGKDD